MPVEGKVFRVAPVTVLARYSIHSFPRVDVGCHLWWGRDTTHDVNGHVEVGLARWNA